MNKKLYRSNKDKKLAGVCGGVAEYFGFDPTILRVAWALLTLFAGLSLWVYIVLALIIPEDPGVIDI